MTEEQQIAVGIPKEIKESEYRVGATPWTVQSLIRAGHKVLVQTKAGLQAGYPDELYARAGASVVQTPAEVFQADMIVKVKEPQESEYPLFRSGQLLFAYLHLAPNPQLAKALIDANVVAIAYETVTDAEGKLPLLTPMSEIAGRMAIQAGA